MVDYLDARQRAMLAEMGVMVWERAPQPLKQTVQAQAPAPAVAPQALPAVLERVPTPPAAPLPTMEVATT